MVPLALLNHLNTLWPVLIVSELAKNGIDTYFVSPGNRNIPILAALNAVDGVFVKFCPDERASAYRAIGHAKASGAPGVLVCTSGTAAANYYPAVIESFRDEIPMIVWSADRPPELVGADANQTIKQACLFGCFIRKNLNLPCPSANYPIHALLSGICDLAAVKNGPVHINLPFREPLLPVSRGKPVTDPETSAIVRAASKALENLYPHMIHIDSAGAVPAASHTDSPDMLRVKTILEDCKRGLVVVGRPDTKQSAQWIKAFVEKQNWPVFFDISSGLKGCLSNVVEVPFFDHLKAISLVLDYNPDVIVQFGTGLVSKAYYDAVLKGKNQPPKLIQITTKKGIRDPSHSVDVKMEMTTQKAVSILGTTRLPEPDKGSASRLAAQFDLLVQMMGKKTPGDILSHPLIVKTVFSLLPDNEALFIGNSLVIRAFDTGVSEAGKRIDIVSNRGVSGIEGNIATAVGYAESAGKRITAVIGDISFLHDLNSLMLAAQSQVPVVILVINNRGGRIFERLPVAAFEGIPLEWVTTPHPYRFEMAANQFNIPYMEAGSPEELMSAYGEALKRSCSVLVEIRVSPEEDLRIYKARNALHYP